MSDNDKVIRLAIRALLEVVQGRNLEVRVVNTHISICFVEKFSIYNIPVMPIFFIARINTLNLFILIR